MMAQLSQSAPRGSSGLSIAGVRLDGIIAMYSGVRVAPQALTSSKGRPAARRNTRTERLFTLGPSMCSLIVSGMGEPPGGGRIVVSALRLRHLSNPLGTPNANPQGFPSAPDLHGARRCR